MERKVLAPMEGTAPASLPTLPSNPSSTNTLPTFPTNPSITLPAQPPNPLFPRIPNNNTSTSTAAVSSPDAGLGSHLILIAVLGVFVFAVAVVLLWLLVFLIRKQKQRLMSEKTGQCTHKESGLSVVSKDSPPNPLNDWLRGKHVPLVIYLLGRMEAGHGDRFFFADSTAFRRFSYSEVQKATDNFSTVIGKGGFGTVYKGRFDDGLIAAVKRMYRVSRQREKEFCKEMEFLGRLHHRHLVWLRGFCITNTERFLIYEYMENGSLKEHLRASHSKTPLDWRTRIQIAIDVAAALEYLHFFCDPALCHRDIKSSNILLDQQFVAKVADFGLAHATPSPASNHEQISTDVRGTPGYLDPEYVITRQLTVKSDIYSYGVLLLELITARGAVQDNKNLVSWAQPYLVSESKAPLMVDPDLEENYNPEELLNMVKLIKMCTHKEGKSRPTIRQVLSFLYEQLEKEGNSVFPRTGDGNSESVNNAVINVASGSAETPGFTSNFSSTTQSAKAYRFDTTSVTSVSDKLSK